MCVGLYDGTLLRFVLCDVVHLFALTFPFFLWNARAL